MFAIRNPSPPNRGRRIQQPQLTHHTTGATISLDAFERKLRMSRPRYRCVFVAIAFAFALCLLLAALLLLPARDSLAALQREIAETGTCRIPTPASDLVIQADTARIEDDMLILERNAETGDNSLVVVHIFANSIAARRVSIRFMTSPKDSLELTLHDPEPVGTSKMLYGTSGLDASVVRLRLDRHWTLRQWFHHFRAKIKRAFK